MEGTLLYSKSTDLNVVITWKSSSDSPVWGPAICFWKAFQGILTHAQDHWLKSRNKSKRYHRKVPSSLLIFQIHSEPSSECLWDSTCEISGLVSQQTRVFQNVDPTSYIPGTLLKCFNDMHSISFKVIFSPKFVVIIFLKTIWLTTALRHLEHPLSAPLICINPINQEWLSLSLFQRSENWGAKK